MESLLERMEYAKNILTIANSLQSSDCDQAHILAASAETILKRVNQGLTDFLDKHIDYEHLISGTSPRLNDSKEILISVNAHRDFTAWATSLNLQAAHIIYFGDVLFRLAYVKGRATLTTRTRSGKTITRYSPSEAVNSYLKSIGSLQKNVDGWKRMSMITEKGESQTIGWSGWDLRVWDKQTNKFKLIDE